MRRKPNQVKATAHDNNARSNCIGIYELNYNIFSEQFCASIWPRLPPARDMAAQHLIASLQPGTVFGRITPASISHSNQAVQYQILGRERLGACTSSIPVQRPSLSSGRLHTHTPRSIVAMAAAAESSPPAGVSPQTKTLLCTSLTAPTVSGMLAEADEAMAAGADIVELRIDFLQDFDPERDLAELLGKCPLPSIVTFRPTWEG